MPLGSTFESDLLKLFLCAKAIANIADNAASGPYVDVWSALHTADPTSGNQATSELSLTGYTRVATTRSTVGYTSSDVATTEDHGLPRRHRGFDIDADDADMMEIIQVLSIAGVAVWEA